MEAFEKRHQRLAVRLGHQRFASKVIKLAWIIHCPLIQELGKMPEDIGGKKRAWHSISRPFDRKTSVERLLIGVELKPSFIRIPPDVNLARTGDRFEKSRLTRAVFTDEHSDRGIAREGLSMAKDRKIVRIAVPNRVFPRMDCYRFQVHDRPPRTSLIFALLDE